MFRLCIMIGVFGWMLILYNQVTFSSNAQIEEMKLIVNTVWVLTAAVLVFLMQAGFAMLEAGMTRAKNASNIIMKNLMDFSVGSITFYTIGFALMFGVSKFGLFGGTGFFNPMNINIQDLTLPMPVYILFQTVFAATAATIVSGAMAERTRFKSYLVYSAFITLIVYPVVGHWTWGGGWLASLNFHDFAGSTVVHSVGGWAALMGAMVIGPRMGKYGKNGRVNSIPGHSITLGALGVFILWFGWFGFNAGSTLKATTSLGLIAMNTNLAAAMGAIVTMVYTWLKQGKPNVSYTLNGVLGGLVAITAGADVVSMGGAMAIGALAGFIVTWSVDFIDAKLKVDDPVGAVAVHGICGSMGTIAVAFFSMEEGIFYGGSIQFLGVQVLGVLSVAAWTMGLTFLLFKTLERTLGLRVEKEDEEVGLDRGEHSTQAYSDFMLNTPKNMDEEEAEEAGEAGEADERATFLRKLETLEK